MSARVPLDNRGRARLKALDRDGLESWAVENGLPAYRGRQLFGWLYGKNAASFQEMTDLPASLRDQLDETACIELPRTVAEVKSSDGTIKRALELASGALVETVLIPELANDGSVLRMTACVSSQVGCAMGCTFCATGKMGFQSDLTVGEIVDQAWMADRLARNEFGSGLSNIVFMGMGEPLMNYSNVVAAIEIIGHPSSLGLSPKRITVSTVGLAKMIRRLADDRSRVNLAISLHAPTDEKRSSIMPVNRSQRTDLKALREAVRYFYAKLKRPVTYEYCMLSGFNDTVADANALASICGWAPAKVNLIMYNAVSGTGFEATDEAQLNRFIRVLVDRSVRVTVRRSRGQDINAACGQLATTSQRQKRNTLNSHTYFKKASWAWIWGGLLLLLATTSSFAQSSNGHPELEGGDAWIDSVAASLTLEQKVGQLFAVSATGKLYNESDPEYRDLVDLVERIEVGGVIFFSGEPLAQALLTNDLQSRARIPLLVSQDMEWGVGMRLDDATEFPRAMSVGATGEPDLAYAMGRVVAAEARSLGIHVNYAPVVDVNNNPGNPVINVRSFGEDPDAVGEMSAAYTRGLEDGGMIATAKHFPGHGDTDVDSHASRPVLDISRSRLDEIELVPFRMSIEAGADAVMVAHIALPEVDGQSNVPSTLSRPIVSEILRGDLGFDGLIVTDAMRMDAIRVGYTSGQAAILALDAGIDQILLPDDFHAAHRAVLKAVESGRISEERIDESVRRILSAKYRTGLGSYKPADPATIRRTVSDPASTALARTIAERGITLLENDGRLVPIRNRPARILDLTLSDSDYSTRGRSFHRSLRRHLGRATVHRELLDRRSHKSEYERVREMAGDFDLILIQTHAIVRSGSGRIGLNEPQQDIVNDLIASDVPVGVVAFGNPYIGMGFDRPDVMVVAYSSDPITVEIAAELLTGQIGFRGRLPVTIPGRYEIGSGIDTEPIELRTGIPEDFGMDSKILARLDTMLWNAIEDTAFPGAAFAVGRAGAVARADGFGYFTYTSEQQTDTKSLFDLASLTKVIATTSAIMKLYEQGRIELDEPLSTYLPAFGGGDKDSVTVRQILTHTSGLAPFYSFEHMGITDRDAIIDFIGSDSLVYAPDSSYRYSDLGMIMMAVAVEEVSGQSFDAFLADHIFEPLGMLDTGFRPVGGRGTDTTVVPTEYDSLFRKQLVQGEVHDERAWMLGGAAGHAGLFSTAQDLARFASMMLNGGVGNGVRIFEPETIELFTTRYPNDLDHTRALGWDTRSTGGYSSAGEFFGPRSYGHTGFTGTSIWIDPDANVFAILLTNRVYPTRANGKIRYVRPRFADIVFLSITGAAELDLQRFVKEPF